MLRSVALIASFLAFAAPLPAVAQAIGDATTVVRDVKGVIAGRTVPVVIGDTVYRDQIVRTMTDSSAVLTFLDKTGMAIGPTSEVRLDDFVFGAKAGTRTVDAVKGFFRFISGPGDAAHDYRVRTPHATIAVRGTTFDVRVTDTQTTVVLHEGAIDVCNGGACRSVKPGETVDSVRGDVQTPRPRTPADWTFTSTPRREQRAALEKAETILKTTSASHHEAHARRVAATKAAAAEAAAKKLAAATPPRAPEARPQATLPVSSPVSPPAEDPARKVVVPADPSLAANPVPVKPAPASAQADEPTAKPDQLASAMPQAVSPASANGPIPAVGPAPVLPLLDDGLPPLARQTASEPGVRAELTAAADPSPEPTAAVQAPDRAPGAAPRDAFAMPAGAVLTDGQPSGEPVLATTGPAGRLLATPSRTHDPAITVAVAPPPEIEPTLNRDWQLPMPEVRARAGPPLRPG